MNQKYTDEQVKDIQEREAKAIEALKELQMTLSAQVVAVNVGDNTFANKVIPYLSDMKYTAQEGDVESPIRIEEGKIVDEPAKED